MTEEKLDEDLKEEELEDDKKEEEVVAETFEGKDKLFHRVIRTL